MLPRTQFDAVPFLPRPLCEARKNGDISSLPSPPNPEADIQSTPYKHSRTTKHFAGELGGQSRCFAFVGYKILARPLKDKTRKTR